jgi:hypothetical protein
VAGRSRRFSGLLRYARKDGLCKGFPDMEVANYASIKIMKYASSSLQIWIFAEAVYFFAMITNLWLNTVKILC